MYGIIIKTDYNRSFQNILQFIERQFLCKIRDNMRKIQIVCYRFKSIILYSNLLMVDYYKILGISRDSNNNSIKRAYHKMARKFHPDKNPDKGRKYRAFKQIIVFGAVA